MNYNQAIQTMQRQGCNPVRTPRALSWGDRAACGELFRRIMQSVDRSIERYEHLPEYEHIIDWMTDTRGKGLLLKGDCGRGKSAIIAGVVPVLLTMKGWPARPVHAEAFETFCKVDWPTQIAKPRNIDYLCHALFPIIDELGVEPRINDYGERYEGFNKIINVAEMKLNPVFVSTNLTSAQLLDRYDARTIERLVRLCRTVEFQGESLRR